MGPFIFLAGMVLGVLVTLLAARLADRLPPMESGNHEGAPTAPEEHA